MIPSSSGNVISLVSVFTKNTFLYYFWSIKPHSKVYLKAERIKTCFPKVSQLLLTKEQSSKVCFSFNDHSDLKRLKLLLSNKL